MAVLALFVALMAFDGFNSLAYDLGWQSLYQPTNTLRLITGFGCGVAIATIISVIFAQTAWQQPIWIAPLTQIRELALFMMLTLPPIYFILRNQTNLSYVLSIASAIGTLIILAMLYTVLILIATRRDGQLTQAVQLRLPLSAGFALSVVQIIVIATLRYQLTGTWVGF